MRPSLRLFAPLCTASAIVCAVSCAAAAPQDDPPNLGAGTAARPGGEEVTLFDGETLAGWTGEDGLWSVETVENVPTIVGVSEGLDHNTFLTTDRTFADFDLTFEMKLTPNEANSGIQFRSERLAGEDAEEDAGEAGGHGVAPGPDSEMRGYQADAGASWWGKLYEENARGMLYPAAGRPEQKDAGAAVKPGGWNVYRIRAEGDRIRTWLNGAPSVDLVDPAGRKEGLIGLQMHSGGPMTVRFRRFVMRTL